MKSTPDMAALRAFVAQGGGRALWRSFDALAETPAFLNFVRGEFSAASRLADGPDRRRFFKLMAASFALAGLAGCDSEDPRDYEVPYVRNPEHRQPGAKLSFATASLLDGFANGVLATTVNGRPIKIEGNPEHPWSRGGTDVFAQASVLGLYDPFRSQAVLNLGRPSSCQAFEGMANARFADLLAASGRGLRVLTGPVTSPSFAAQLAAMQARFPEMVWHSHAAIGREAMEDGAVQAFGRNVETRWRFDRVDLVVSLGGDFLDAGPHQVGAARDWSDSRRAAASSGRLLTLHSAVATPNLTSAKADHHAVGEPWQIEMLAATLLDGDAADPGNPLSAWRARAASALKSAHGRSIVLAGTQSSAIVHADVHRLNAALGNFGQTVFATDPVPVQAASLTDLVQAMQAGHVSVLVVLGPDPVYTAPAGLGFAASLDRVPLKIHAGLYADATALRSDWHLPLTHPLESWGDARAMDGTVTLMQPTIGTLYGGRSAAEILSLLAEAQPSDGRALLERHWLKDAQPIAPEAWRGALAAGFLKGSAYPEIAVSVKAGPAPAPRVAPKDLTVLFAPDPTVWDGAFANNAWLQELPKPLTKLVWDNVLSVSPKLAERMGLANGDVVTVAAEGRSIEAPVWITPGQAENTVTATLGYGGIPPDLPAANLGYDAYALQAEGGRIEGAVLTRTGRRAQLATTQDHGAMEGGDFIRVSRIGEVPHAPIAEAASFYPPKADEARAWGMVIDLDSCIGCNACVVACQSENNIAVVGKQEVALGREMHWLRIDRYNAGSPDDPDTHFQPVPCMQCEDAPCEVGCPVEATLHDHEGLNLMVYNRCVGTRACSGYCPYKVRHFNYLDYSGGAAPSIQVQRNPDVTVRAGGVMEKCTYCVQRIADARIVSDRTGAPIPDGGVVTACQGACPTRAISFGDLNDKASVVRGARHDARNYALLGELGVRPRTTYLGKLAPSQEKG